MTRPLIVAHRGNSSVAPENTMLAFGSAVRAGADMIEIDVHVDGDGTFVVIHDDTVDRTTDGTGAVQALSTEDIRRLDAGAGFAVDTAGQRVPLLTDVVDLMVVHPHLRLLLELKGDWEPDQVKQLLGVLEPVLPRVLPQSFYVATVRALGEVAPDAPRGLLVLGIDEAVMALCADLGVTACNPYVGFVRENIGVIADLHAAGLQTFVWTANEPEQWRLLVDAGVDGVITDRPDRLGGWLDAVQ
ncbi:glycerophosphodiester phosphodiesterase [Rhodococcus sp. ABRD24]|uniref:glycerophosphodiester phosphodiesterase n=1 Tax=Rhodococcus sp. ABRD24 TaxID=2507582 RepID=UPI00104062A8|nr:glycerophosphodiester phosphodiesterase family protein [Rhodococcus sp. ABRD24]QBJ96493.1 glycerophosphodiester phosphodiesterase [Rhodococcus sp. ABRD24]